jgi:organic radical activating enzyme
VRIALAPNPVYWTIQGEAHLRGFQMVFVRLAGCSVGCPECDTDYSVDSRATPEEVAEMAHLATPAAVADRWAWVTGGEPADLPQAAQRDLIGALQARGFRVAVATSGSKAFVPPVDWLSVSPHKRGRLAQPYGNEVKLVEGLNGLDPDAFLQDNPSIRFMYQYVQPLSVGGREDPASLARCQLFLGRHPNWSLSRQDHLHWGLP